MNTSKKQTKTSCELKKGGKEINHLLFMGDLKLQKMKTK